MKASFAARPPGTPGILVPVQLFDGSQVSRLFWFGPRVRLSPLVLALGAASLIALPFPGHAACTPAGTDIADLIACSAGDTAGVNARAGDDSVAVQTGASINVNGSKSASPTVAIDAGTGNDTVTNQGTVSAASTTTNNSVAAASVGIAGGAGDDTLDNRNTIAANASTTATSVSIPLTLGGGDVVTATTTVEANAVGMAGGAGHDAISNNTPGSIGANAQAEVGTINTELNLVDTSHGGATTTSTATAIGIDTGAGTNSTISNRGGITSIAESHSNAVNVEVNLVDAAMADASLTIDAIASGIRTGTSQDSVTNEASGAIDVYASSTVSDVAVNASFVDLTIVDRTMGSATTTLNATATGVDGTLGEAGQHITNDGRITVGASSNVHSTGVSLASEGVPATTEVFFKNLVNEIGIAGLGFYANSTSTGIAGGAGDDVISNQGNLFINADSTATQESINVGVSLIDWKIPTPGFVLGSAGTSATSVATGINGIAGNDTITNSGLINVTTDATASAVTVSANIAGFSENVFGGKSIPVLGAFSGSMVVSDTVTAASASSTGIQGGADDDTITNSDRVNASASAIGGSVSAAATLNIKFKEGENLFSINAVGARAKTTADATAVSLDGGNGNDQITNNATLNANAQADARTISAALSVAGAVKGSGGTASLAAADTSSVGTASATGIFGGAGDDSLLNTGTINATADADVLSVSASLSVGIAKQGLVADMSLARSESIAIATGIGMDSGGGHDRLQNTGTVNSTADADANAVSVSVSASGTNKGLAIGGAMTDASTTANATAIGMKGGAAEGVTDSDLSVPNISNTSTISVDADAATHSTSVSLSVSIAKEGVALGGALADSSTTAHAIATGIEGGAGNDRILNDGAISVVGDADTLAVSVGVSVSGTTSGFAAGAALTDTHATSNAIGTGIDAGAGNDVVRNTRTIQVQDLNADASSVGVSVAGSFAENGLSIGVALARSGTEANAFAKGIDGKDGNDRLTNENTITLQRISADADAVTVSAGLAGSQTGLSIAASLAQAAGEANARASGIEGGSGNDILTNTAGITAQDIEAQANAASISVALAGANNGVALGVSLADTSATARSTAKGLDGGAENDTLSNSGMITLQRVTSEGDALSVGVSISAAIGAGVGAAGALARASANAESVAIGLDGNDGNDSVTNTGTINVRDIDATARAIGVSVSLGISNAGVALGASASDTSANADSTAKGLLGGAGNDHLSNQGAITLQNITADASTTSVGVTVNAAIQGGVAAGLAWTDASSNAQVNVTGMDGGAGNDTLRNTNIILVQNTEADAHATGISVSLNASVAGVAAGAALANTSGNATIVIRGMDGGADDDTLVNTNGIILTGRSKADGLSVAVSVNAALGVAAGIEITDASTNAQTIITGMEGGSGRDDILNTGTIDVTSSATANASSISAGVSLGLGGDLASADARSIATATTIGIGDASGTNVASVIDNQGAVTLNASSNTSGLALAADLKGLALGDITNASTTESYGIRTGDGVDQVSNTGAIIANATAVTTGIAISAGFAGVVRGDATTHANAVATGIATGGGDDLVDNNAMISNFANSSANVAALNIEFAGTSDGDASTQASATAIGIDGGAGNDQLANRSQINLFALARSTATNVSLTLFGTSDGDSQTNPTSSAVGLKGGDGNDNIVNTGDISSIALSLATVTSASFTFGGTSSGSAGTTAISSAVGLDGGAGDDSLTNHANSFDVSARAEATATSASWTLAGTSSDSASLAAIVHATGLDGGDGHDSLRNETAISVRASAELEVTGGSSTIFGNAGTDTKVGADAFATGLNGGAGNDTITNLGALTVTSESIVTSTKTAFSFAGGANIDELLKSQSRATGIDGGSGSNAIYNDAAITINATAHATTNGSASASLGGGTSASGKAVADAGAIGIAAGSGDDKIENRGTLTVTATIAPVTNNSSSAGTFFGSGQVQGRIDGTLNATGIDAGGGNNVIINRGNITANAFTFQDGTTLSAVANTYASGSDFSFLTGGSGNAYSETRLDDVNATGIRGGNGSNGVLNTGSIAVHIDNTLAGAYTDPNGGATSGSGNGTSDAIVSAVGSGIQLGDGNNTIINSGTIDVIVSPLASSTTDADGTGLDNANGTVYASTYGEAYGIRTGAGSNRIINSGAIHVTGAPISESLANVDGGHTGGDGNGTSNTYTNTKVTGIAAGDVFSNTDSYIENNALLSVTASNLTRPNSNYVNVYGDGWNNGDAVANIYAQATAEAIGISTGIGTHTIINTGTIAVTAEPTASFGWRIDGGGGPAGHTLAAASTYAEGRATGILIGGGNVSIINRGDITVSALPHSTQVTWDGDGGPFIMHETFGVATGIEIRNNGNQSVTNSGHITAIATGSLSIINDGDVQSPAVLTRIGAPPVAQGIVMNSPGQKEVVNDGTLEVHATSTVLIPDPNYSRQATAIGIVATGDSATVTNNGTITVTETVNGFSSAGYAAIITGSGDDTIRLGPTSITNGDVYFGGGNSTFVLEGNPVLNGAIQHDPARSFSLVLNNSGFFGHALPTVINATKNGTGTYTLPTLNTVQRLVVNQGTLKVANNYQFSNTGLFQANLYPDGSNGRLAADGTATLGGDMKIVRGAGVYQQGMTFDVVTAGNGIAAGSAFTSVELPAATTLVSFHAQQLFDRVRIGTDVASFTTVAGNPKQDAIAKYLDDILHAAPEKFAPSLEAMQAMTDGKQLASAFTSLDPTPYTNAPIASLNSNQRFSNAMLSCRVREGEHRFVQEGECSWGRVMGRISKRDETANAASADEDALEISGGVQKAINGNWYAGFGISYEDSNLTTADLSTSDGNRYQVGGILKAVYGAATFSVSLSGGEGRYDTQRFVNFPVVGVTATGKQKIDFLSSHLRAAYAFERGNGYVRPLIDLGVSRTRLGAFSETGAGAANLDVQQQTETYVSVQPALEIGIEWVQDGGTLLRPFAVIGATHYLSGTNPEITASMQGAPIGVAPFTVKGDMDKTFGNLMLGVDILTIDGKDVRVSYDGQFSENTTTHAFALKFSAPF